MPHSFTGPEHADTLSPAGAPGPSVGRDGAAGPEADARAGVSRRAFLGASAAGLACAGALAGAGTAVLPRTARAGGRTVRSTAPAGTARNLIFVVADGMAHGALTLGDLASQRLHGHPTRWTRLVQGTPGLRRTLTATSSNNSLVTDSAAASSAWSIGLRHDNGVLCIGPDGVKREPLLLRAQRTGRRVGVVTTTTVTHATPAGFYANVPGRNDEARIAAQWLERPIDLALGGGRKFFDAEALAAAPQVRTLGTRDELLALRGAGNAVAGGRLLGLFERSHVPFALDRGSEHPSLAEMTAFALERLTPAAGGEGFVLQIEGGRVDHAGHNNDACAIVHEQLDFDAALGLAADFALARTDTLLVFCTDHATANPGLTLYGREGDEGLTRLIEARQSFEWVLARLGEAAKDAPPEDLAPPRPEGAKPQLKPVPGSRRLVDLLREATGVSLGEAERVLLERLFSGERVHPFAEANTPVCVMGALVADALGVSFVSPNHTADHVEHAAFGPGAERFEPTGHLTDVHAWVAGALDLPPAQTM